MLLLGFPRHLLSFLVFSILPLHHTTKLICVRAMTSNRKRNFIRLLSSKLKYMTNWQLPPVQALHPLSASEYPKYKKNKGPRDSMIVQQIRLGYLVDLKISFTT